jgi:hypothetical protein
MSDDLIHDLKIDNTLPENFDSLEAFRWYLKMEGACIQAMRVTRPVWTDINIGWHGGRCHD